jgi:hypothetical protein
MTFFEPYVDALLHLGRLDDAAAALERWQQSIAKKNDQALMGGGEVPGGQAGPGPAGRCGRAARLRGGRHA